MSASEIRRHPARGSLVWENVRIALNALFTSKLRSLLTLLGILIGVATVVAMVTVITGLGRSMKRQIASLGTGVLYVSKQEAGIHVGGDFQSRKDLTQEDALAIASFCPDVAAVSPEVQDGTHVTFAGVKTSVLTLQGVTESFTEVNEWYPAVGRFLTEDDVRHRAPVCVLGQAPAELLFPHGGAVGQWVQVGERRLQVIGVLSAKGKFLGQNMDDVVLAPLPVVALRGGWGRSVDYIVVRPIDPGASNTARDQIEELLRRRRGVRADQPNDFGITSQENLLQIYRQVTGAFYLVTLVISSIGLLVGGIGVMNMMLITVRERTREIGIRAALGARRKDILGQFLTEAVTLTLVGGLLGIGLGLLLALGVKLAFHVPLALSPAGVAAALIISGGTGLFFGLYPAWRASRLDPIEALRYE